jgi:3-hydroxyisobutyrate dehydrogenase
VPDNYPERAFSVEYALKDLEYALELAKHARAELPGARNAKALLERAAAAGLGKKYFPVLAKIL